MKNIYFEDFEDLADNIADKLDCITELNEYNDISVIAKYEETRQIIKELLCIGYDIANIHLGKERFKEYWDEYITTITNIDGNMEVWCEPFMRDGKYLTDGSTVIYILDNCSSKVIPYCKSETIFEVTVGEEECDCDECCGCCDDNCECDKEFESDNDTEFTEDIHGFTVSNSDENGFYSFSLHSSDKNFVSEMAKLFK